MSKQKNKAPTSRHNARPSFTSRSVTLRFAPDGKPQSLDETTRSVEFVAATEVPTLVWDWERWDTVMEVLLVSCVRLPESGRCVFLDTHSRESVSAVIGSFRDQQIVQGKTGTELKGRSYYSSTPDGVGPYIKTVEGHVTDVSIGYEVNAFVWIEEGHTTMVEGRQFTGPLRVVTDWTLKELSLCPIGADANATVRSERQAVKKENTARQVALGILGRENLGEKEKEQTMKKRKAKRQSARSHEAEILSLRAQLARAEAERSRAKLREAEQAEGDADATGLPEEEDENQGSEATASDEGEDDDSRTDEADQDEDYSDEEDSSKKEVDGRSVVKKERARIAEIRSICSSFGLSQDQEDKYVRKGTSIASVRKEVMGLLKAQRGAPALAGARGQATQQSKLVADAARRNQQPEQRR